MKKTLSCILVLSLGFGLAACSAQEKKKQSQKENFDIKIATNILESYMQYLKKDDIENIENLYSKELKEKQKGNPLPTDLKIEGYKVDEINEVGRSGLFKVRVTRATPSRSMSILDTYNIKIEKEKSDYKISDINAMTEKEAFIENNGIRLRQKNNVKTNLVVDLGGIPHYAYPKNDKASIHKILVPRKSFGMINFAYSGEELGISTFDKDSFIGVIKIDETMATQGGSGGGGGGGGQGGGGGGGGDQGGGGSSQPARETPVGKEITAIDLLKDTKVDLMAFSLDEKYIMVQYSKPQLGRNIRVYDTDSGELIPVSIEDKFPPGKFNVTFSSFDKDVLNFQVTQINNTGKDQADLIGKWQISLKDFKMKKL